MFSMAVSRLVFIYFAVVTLDAIHEAFRVIIVD